MKRVTYYLSEEAIQLIDHMYALKIIEGKKASKGDIVTEAVLLLVEKQKEKE